MSNEQYNTVCPAMVQYNLSLKVLFLGFKDVQLQSQSNTEKQNDKFLHTNTNLIQRTKRSDILQGQALFRGVKQLRRCLVMINNFEKFSFPSIEKRWTKDKETDGQKEKRQEKTKKRKKKEKKEKEKQKKEKRKKNKKKVKKKK